MIKEKQQLRLSPLGHTWFLDFDGTLVEHNGYKTGDDRFLPGAKEFLQSIPKEDYVLITTAREKEAREKTEAFLKKHNIRCNEILFEMPMEDIDLANKKATDWSYRGNNIVKELENKIIKLENAIAAMHNKPKLFNKHSIGKFLSKIHIGKKN